MTMVGIVCESNRGKQIMDKAGMLGILDECGISYECFFSSEEGAIREWCKKAQSRGVKIFLVVISNEEVLDPSTHILVADATNNLAPVICVPLDLSNLIWAVNSGWYIAVPGFAETGLKNAAVLAAQILGLDGDMTGMLIKQKLASRETKRKEKGV